MTRETGWTLAHYAFCFDALIDGQTAEKIAIGMTKRFKRKFTRGGIIGRINRDFGGIEILLNNILNAWPKEPRAEKIKILLRKKFGGRLA